MIRLLRILPIVLLLAGVPGARATTYVLPADGALVDQADVIAQVTVAAVEPAPIAGPPSTDYFVQIERVLEGHMAGGTVVVRVPGGIGPDGMGLRIWGAPQFREGERLLLFLAPRSDGTYGLLHLMLGAFREVETGGRRTAVRGVGEAVELTAGGASGLEAARDWAGFVQWIEDRAAGSARRPDYLLDAPAVPPAGEAGSSGLLEESCTSLAFRWFAFDRGEAVRWQIAAGGFDGAGGGRRSLDRARRLWNRGSGGAVALGRGPAVASTDGLTAFDGVNGVLFDDPNDLVSGAFRCSAGGVVSVTGLWFENGRGQACEWAGPARRGTFEGRRYLEIVGADIVANDGAACLFRGDPATTTRVLAHELGHSLGLSHRPSEDSLMQGQLVTGYGFPEKSILSPIVPSTVDLETVARLYGRR